MSEKNVPNRRYTEEFKEEAARLANSVGHNEAARRWQRLGIGHGDNASKAWFLPLMWPSVTRAKPAVSELEAENSRLKKELARVKLDLEILAKATAYFAKGAR